MRTACFCLALRRLAIPPAFQKGTFSAKTAVSIPLESIDWDDGSPSNRINSSLVVAPTLIVGRTSEMLFVSDEMLPEGSIVVAQPPKINSSNMLRVITRRASVVSALDPRLRNWYDAANTWCSLDFAIFPPPLRKCTLVLATGDQRPATDHPLKAPRCLT